MRRLISVLALVTLLLLIGSNVFAQQPTPAPGQTVHVVAPGETMFRISLRYGVSVQAIASANGIANPSLIYVGQRLTIPAAGTTPPPATPAPGGGTPPTPPPTSSSTYTVQRGDTLGRIAARFGVTVAAVASANGITNPNRIFAGQVLNIPAGGTTPPPTSGGTTPPPTSGGATTSGFELGGHVERFAFPDQMRGARMTWAKIQVFYNQGDAPSTAQGAIDAARSRGFKILLGTSGNPAQVAANPTQFYNDFANWLAGVAALGPDGIEIWNEPNIDRQWPAGQISGGNYTQMLAAAYNAIKRVNPNILVISGAPAPTGFFGGRCAQGGCDDDIFLRQMRDAGAANYADCIGAHYNEGILPPSARSGDPRGNSGHYTRYFGTMLDLYAGTFPNKSICWTELGYLSPEGLGALPAAFGWAQSVTVQQQAEWLAQAVTLSRQSRRVRLMIVWNVDFTQYGADPQAGYAIIRPDNTCRACITLGAAMQ